MQPTIARYRDCADAGAVLGTELMKYAGQNVAVFGVGSGGLTVAAPIARALGADLDVLAARPLSLPGQPDRVWGAVAMHGECAQIVADQDIEPRRYPIIEPANNLRQRDLDQLRNLDKAYRGVRPPEPVTGRLIIVVADGLTRLTVMRAAASAVRRQHPARLVYALPAGTTACCTGLRKAADEVICPVCIGLFHPTAPVYRDEVDISVNDVRRLLAA